MGTGEPFGGEDEQDRPTQLDGKPLAWPVRSDGRLGIWRVGREKLMSLVDRHFAFVSMQNASRGTWTLRYLMEGTVAALDRGEIKIVGEGPNGEALFDTGGLRGTTAKTMWVRPRHIAGGVGGTQLLSAMVGTRGAFTFPKSVYAVQDTLDILTHDKPDALIVDFFAGSGTTLHATLLLNVQDQGRRRCVLVTNNEVRAETAAQLNRHDHFRGDPEFEAAGVFEAATRPRVSAAITGVRADGKSVVGTYLDGREYAEGFAENVEFFRLDYLDPAEVEFGLRFRELHPLLWLRAGGIGEREDLDPSKPLGLPAKSPYAVLFDPSGMPDLLRAIRDRRDITHVFIVADSPETFSQLASDLPPEIDKVRLYRDYIETMRGATR